MSSMSVFDVGERGSTNGLYAATSRWLSSEIRIEFFKDFVAGLFDVYFKVFEDARGYSVTFTEYSEEDMFGADVRMVQRFGLSGRQCQRLLHARRIRDIADHFLFGSDAYLLFDFCSKRIKIE